MFRFQHTSRMTHDKAGNFTQHNPVANNHSQIIERRSAGHKRSERTIALNFAFFFPKNESALLIWATFFGNL